MSEWKEYKLGELCDFQAGTAFPNDYQGEISGDYPFIKVSDMNLPGNERIIWYANNWINEKACRKLRAKIHPKDATVFAKIGVALTYNRRRLLKQPSIIDNNMMSAIACDNVIPLFLYYLLCTLDFNDIASGTAVPYININDLKRVHVKIPPLPEQRAIASVLSSLDDKIDLLHRENKTLEAMAETLFRQWFIEEAKDEWEEVPLSEVFDFKEGPGIRNWQYKDKGIPFINIRLISNGEIDVSKANFIDAVEANEKYNHFYLQRKDMVVSTSGTLGKTAIIRNYHLPLLLNTSVIRFRPKDGINYSFMYGYLKSRSFYECLMDSASGSVQLNFGPMHLKQIIMQIPPKEKLENFRKIADPIYEKIELNYFQIHTLEKLRDTLLPKLMSGEVRVKYEEEEMASCRA